MSIFTDLSGAGEQLTPLQMSCRAFVTFFIALPLIRIAGMRTFGRKSAFDIIVGIMLGALLVRGVIGASPFFSVVAAGFVSVILHRLIASIAVSHEWIGKIVKGENRVLYKNGAIQWKEMRKSGVSEKDLMERVRIEANVTCLDEIEEARMERDGEISVVKKTSA
jgi:uncharacterized membrane protein YcaP (DUF421 family)